MGHIWSLLAIIHTEPVLKPTPNITDTEHYAVYIQSHRRQKLQNPTSTETTLKFICSQFFLFSITVWILSEVTELEALTMGETTKCQTYSATIKSMAAVGYHSTYCSKLCTVSPCPLRVRASVRWTCPLCAWCIQINCLRGIGWMVSSRFNCMEAADSKQAATCTYVKKYHAWTKAMFGLQTPPPPSISTAHMQDLSSCLFQFEHPSTPVCGLELIHIHKIIQSSTWVISGLIHVIDFFRLHWMNEWIQLEEEKKIMGLKH